MELGIGDFVEIVKGDTTVMGIINGWHRIEHEVITINIEGIEQSFAIGDWMVVGDDE